MDAFVCLLRGVNVGGHNRVPMQELRRVCEDLGLQDVATVLNSGNAVFRAPSRNTVRLAARIEDALQRELRVRPAVFLRSATGMAAVVEANPFAGRDRLDAARLAVMFLHDAPEPTAVEKAAALASAGEELRPAGREIYVYFPNGMGRSKIPAVLDRILRSSWTGRNWNTVRKLAELAGRMERRESRG